MKCCTAGMCHRSKQIIFGKGNVWWIYLVMYDFLIKLFQVNFWLAPQHVDTHCQAGIWFSFGWCKQFRIHDSMLKYNYVVPMISYFWVTVIELFLITDTIPQYNTKKLFHFCLASYSCVWKCHVFVHFRVSGSSFDFAVIISNS